MEPGTFAGLRVSSAPAVSSVIPQGDLCRRQSWLKELLFLPFPPGASGRGEQSCPSLLSVSHSPEVTTAKIKLMARAGSTARGWLLMATALKYC